MCLLQTCCGATPVCVSSALRDTCPEPVPGPGWLRLQHGWVADRAASAKTRPTSWHRPGKRTTGVIRPPSFSFVPSFTLPSHDLRSRKRDIGINSELWARGQGGSESCPNFTVTCDWKEAGAYTRFSMGRFVTGTSSENDAEREVPRYSFVSKEGSYQLELDGDMLIHSSDQRDVLNHFAWHVNSHAMQAATDRLVIHSGAAVSPRGGAVLLPGPSGSGKTGLVAGLVRAGFGYLSDEAAGIDPETGLECLHIRSHSRSSRGCSTASAPRWTRREHGRSRLTSGWSIPTRFETTWSPARRRLRS